MTDNDAMETWAAIWREFSGTFYVEPGFSVNALGRRVARAIEAAEARGAAQRPGPTDNELYAAIKPLWLAAKPSTEAQKIRAALSCDFDDPRYKQWMSDFAPDYAWSLVDVAAQRGMDCGAAQMRERAAQVAHEEAQSPHRESSSDTAYRLRDAIRALPDRETDQ